MNKFNRKCPNCKKKLVYVNITSFKNAIRKNNVCKNCSQILYPRIYTEESRRKISEKAIEKFKNYTEEQWQKMRADGHKYGILQPKLTEEQRLACCGSGNHFYGRTHTEESKKKMGEKHKGKKLSLAHRIKISKGLIRNAVNVGDKNVAKRPEDKLRKRLLMIEKLKNRYGQVFPLYNKKGCEYFNQLNKSNDWNLQHGENGGEYYLKELGYWLDAYDKDKNIVVEYDERKHYKVNGELKDKDIYRMNEIKNHLNCQFYRYNQTTNELKQY